MTRSRQTPTHIREIRPLYNKKDVVFLNEMILSGLKQLRDNGRENINFLDFTDMSGRL